MTSQPSSNEERNRLRLQAWEQRNHETSQAKGQNTLNVHLFGQPYKTIKGDELSNRIQRMLGSYEDNTTAEPFSVPSSLTFPLSSLIHHIAEPPSHQVCHNSQSQKGPCDNPPSMDTVNSPKHHCEEESQGSSQLILSSLQKMAPSDNNNERQCTTFDRPQHHGSAENTNHVSMQVSCKDTSSPLNRTISMLHPQAFHPPLSYKQPNAAATQKPTAYVRPMDGLDLVVSQSPELKPSPEHRTSVQDVTLEKSIRDKANLLPQFLETKTSELQCVEVILREMTCSWPPLLSGIHSPRPDHTPKTQCSGKEVSSPKQKPSHSHQSPSVFSAETHSSPVDSVCSSDSESSKSAWESESGTDDPPVRTAFKSEPAPVSMASGDWQLDKLIQFRQQNYRSKSQWAQSPKLSPMTDGSKQPTVSVSSPVRETPNLPSSVSLNVPTSQKESVEPSDEMKPIEENRSGGVGVHFARTPSPQKEEPRLKDGPKVKTEKKRHKQSKTRSEITTNHHKIKEKVGHEVSAVQHDQCNSKSTLYSDHVSPACSCGKPKEEASQKKVAKSSQKDECINGYSLGGSKDILSLVVKIKLNFLSRIPRTSGLLETNIVPRCAKDDKPHKVTNCRKNDKEDQSCPKKKRKLHSHNPAQHTARLDDSSPSNTIEKRAKKNYEMPYLSSNATDSAQKSKKHKQCSDNAQQLNQKEPVKCQNAHKKCSGKTMEESAAQKPSSESSSNRPLLKYDNRHHPVKHYIKEAKRLKHKADAEMDKLRKTFHYLDAALFFIESGIAMEKDPQISMSSYTMFAETVELIKFVLKLSNSEDPSPTENDLIALCLRCQALLQMAMFHHKQKTALSYSKTLTDHFNNSSQSASDPSAFIKGKLSPNNIRGGSSSSSSGSAVVPQDIGQVALNYVNITTLFLNAHDLWEKADEFVKKGSGLSAELDKVMGRLSLTSTISFMVRFIRQGLHWLQMNGPKVK